MILWFSPTIDIHSRTHLHWRVLGVTWRSSAHYWQHDVPRSVTGALRWESIGYWWFVVILAKFSSLAAPKVVKMTTFGAASHENFKMTTFSFQWWSKSFTSEDKDLTLLILHSKCYGVLATFVRANVQKCAMGWFRFNNFGLGVVLPKTDDWSLR